MRAAIIESPYAAAPYPWGDDVVYGAFNKELWDEVSIRRHVQYARELMRWALYNGLTPYASHLLYTQPGVLRDDVPAEREMGILAAKRWHELADVAVVGLDYHVSSGMLWGIQQHVDQEREIKFVKLYQKNDVKDVVTLFPKDGKIPGLDKLHIVDSAKKRWA